MGALGWKRGALMMSLAVALLTADLATVVSDGWRLPHPSVVEHPATKPVPPEVPGPAPAAPLPAATLPPLPPPVASATTPILDILTPPVAEPARPTRGGAWTLGPYEGVGVWLDVYDWTNELTGGRPTAQAADVDRMADLGVQTLFIQTAHNRSAADVIEPERLLTFIERAHARGMAVVAWYLPTLEDISVDLRRLVAAAHLPVDGLGVDIESRAIGDPVERTRRLLDLSADLRRVVGRRAIAAITPSAVHLQVINPGFWPGFPWAELALAYDAILPMSYWSIRRGEWRSGERYIGENIDRIRASTGRPDVPIHVIGGIADGAAVVDVQGMVRAIQARGVLGGSLYDWNTSHAAQWEALLPLRAG